MTWLLDTIRQEPDFQVVVRLVRQEDRPVGWYVLRIPTSGLTRVLAVRASPHHLEPTVRAMLADARALGAIGVRGRLDPGMLSATTAQPCLYHVAHRVLLHSRRKEVMHMLATGEAVTTPLIGEWWA
jgi:hypothetical protein